MTIFAIDPGTYLSAYVILSGAQILQAAYVNNEYLQEIFTDLYAAHDSGEDVRLYCEDITPRFGSPIGQETIDTAKWIGRFQEQCRYYGLELILISREEVIQQLKCKKTSPLHKRSGMDAQIRAKMEERWGKGCLDNVPATMLIGEKKKKNIRSHVFQALGLATVMYDLICEGINELFE